MSCCGDGFGCWRSPHRVLVALLASAASLAFACSAASALPTARISEFFAGISPTSRPIGITPGPDGNLWFTDDIWFTDEGSTPAVGRITPSGHIIEYSTGLEPGSLPTGIAAGADGNIWFADNGSTKAIGWQITPSGQISEFSTGLRPGSLPWQINPGPDGNLWFTDEDTPAIGRIGTRTPTG